MRKFKTLVDIPAFDCVFKAGHIICDEEFYCAMHHETLDRVYNFKKDFVKGCPEYFEEIIEEMPERRVTFEDQCLHSLPILVDKIYQENERQVEKWGIQNCTPAEWMLFATEEVGELAEAIAEHEYRGADKEKIVKEAIQAATLILKIAEMYL